MPQVRAQETHSGVVISIGERTYKLKKPVDLGFLDFRSREQRQAVCRREVELNRRLAPDVYLGVADVHGPEGELCEHLVVMRRLPGERSLAALVEAGEAVEDCLDGVAARLAAFHAAAYCVEFDDRLRYVDGADDAATLAMDLQARGRDDLAEQFLRRYADHADDPLPRPLIEHYVAYRALIRTKAACLRWSQSNHEQSEAQQARQLLDLAHHRLRAAAVRLVLVGGPPGTGKSTEVGPQDRTPTVWGQ
jgi:aminoglycoside phosphotransferase family enzyme